MEFLIILCCLLSTSTAQSAKQIVECCGMKLQDVNGNVAMEALRPLTPSSATYTALVVRVCSQEQFWVQVWTQLAPNSFRLKWQLAVTPTANQTMYGPTVFSFDTNPLTVTSSDRLALFMSSTKLNKLPIPYTSLSDGPYVPSLSFSDSNFSASQVPTPGIIASLGSPTLARTFAPYLKFCETPQSCPALTGNLNPPVEASYLPYISVPSTCCDKTVSCDANNGLGTQLTNQINLINSLTESIIQMQQIVNSLLNSTINTGSCPAGFVSGQYGIGNCYKVMQKKLQMAEAAVSCNSFDRSRVVFILSSYEDSFINNLIQNSPGLSGSPMKFWTSALFNQKNQNWYWYNYQLLRNEVFGIYRNWMGKIEPVPSASDDLCATFTRDTTTSAFYWEIANCSQPNYYICKLPKQCL